MAENSKIEWTHHTFNHVIGCTKVAPGCMNCYAEADFDKRRHVAQWGPNGTRIKTSPEKWNRAAATAGVRARVFCASLSDVFEDWQGPILSHNGEEMRFDHVAGVVSLRRDTDPEQHATRRLATLDDVRRDLFKLIDATPNLDWLLLTKRPENVLRMWTPPHPDGHGNAMDHAKTAEILRSSHPHLAAEWLVRPNVWLGTSISDQATADKAIPELLKCRSLCPVLFLSAEPLLGPIKLPFRYGDDPYHSDYGQSFIRQQIDWLIGGGESGQHARPCDVEWIRSLVSQCDAAGVPCFVKQLGSFSCVQFAEQSANGHVWPMARLDKKGGDWNEWPVDLRVRQFPRPEIGVSP